MSSRTRVELSDLGNVIDVLGTVSPDPAAPSRVLELLELNGKQQIAALERADNRWQAAVQVALEYEEDYLVRLFAAVRADLTPRRCRDLDEALSSTAATYVRRLLRAEHPELSDQVDTLISAETYTNMRSAAEDLRRVALDARRMLMDPQLGTELGLQASAVDAERRRLELADLAIDVVTAADYFLNLIRESSAAESSRYSAEHDHDDSQRSRQSDDQDWDDLRYRRALDARAALVRRGGRLLHILRRDSASPGSSNPI